ncbi:hypothetical protein L484_010035 [Morus notabilis]|uniref:Uncharacterized protein n=1 Tax=Morus notabilis TaxID=981085 RepID=W9SA62_9ROSA|nr:hypothetical protein L484_010035 [Morus notabilis]
MFHSSFPTFLLPKQKSHYSLPLQIPFSNLHPLHNHRISQTITTIGDCSSLAQSPEILPLTCRHAFAGPPPFKASPIPVMLQPSVLLFG